MRSSHAVSEAAKQQSQSEIQTVSMSSIGEDKDFGRQKPPSIQHRQEEEPRRNHEPEVVNLKSPPSLPPSAPPLPQFVVPGDSLNQPSEVSAPGQVHSPQEEESPGPAPAPPPPPEDDPWAALQAQYNPKANKSKAALRKSGMEDDDEFEMLAPGVSAGAEIEAEYAMVMKPRSRGSKAVTPSTAVHPNQQSAPAQKPKGGDWGNGDLAMAGTLMLNENEPAPLPSKLNQSLRKPGREILPPIMDYASVPKQAKLDDLGVADFDQSELDALMDDIDEKHNNQMGDELAAKLAKFEADNDD